MIPDLGLGLLKLGPFVASGVECEEWRRMAEHYRKLLAAARVLAGIMGRELGSADYRSGRSYCTLQGRGATDAENGQIC